MDRPTPAALEAFKTEVVRYYSAHARDLPWRHTRDPYAIVVSEVMLQQTQVARVAPKYAGFLAAFPDLQTLAESGVAEVLAVWQGLGYNRRALALHRLATIVLRDHEAEIPSTVAGLRRLPGIGPATAAAICVYAYEQAVPFIETNVRAAFIHHFFQESSGVSDAELLPLVELTLDTERPRDWYYALMDYGAWIKKTEANPSRRSKHHSSQAPFAGSRRQARAAVLRSLLADRTGGLHLEELLVTDPVLSARDPDDVEAIVATLVGEGFVVWHGTRLCIA